MSWSEFLSNLLETTHKVDKAAVFNVKGQPLATTENLQITDQDGCALLRCLRDPSRSLTRITLDDTSFRCFQGTQNALVGLASNDPGRVLVARLTPEALVMVSGYSAGHGSFLFELQQNLLERTRLLVGQPEGGGGGGGGQQQQQQQLLLPAPGKGSLSSDQLLVQFHD